MPDRAGAIARVPRWTWTGGVAGLMLLGALVRALRFWGPLAWTQSLDEIRLVAPATHILEGALPVHILGVDYMGAAPAYPLAAWFALAGVSTLALDLFTYGVGLAILATGYLVARRVLEPAAALATLLVLAVPPLFLARWSLAVHPNWPVLLVLGNLLLIGTHTLFFRHPQRHRTILVLGLLAGLGWWTNPMIIAYLAPLALLAVRTGLLGTARVWLFPAGALLGGLPGWIYEVRHFSTSRFALPGAGFDVTLTGRVYKTIVKMLPGVMGIGSDGPSEPFNAKFLPVLFGTAGNRGTVASIIVLAVLVLGGFALVRALVRDREELRWAVAHGGRSASGGVLLWGTALANLALVILTPRGSSSQYVLPLYSVLPCWLGEALHWLWRRERMLGGIAGAVLVGYYLWASVMDSVGTTPPSGRRWAPQAQSAEVIERWLEARGFDRVYWAADGLAPSEFSYFAGRRVVAADLWREEALADAHRVDAAPAPPILVSLGHPRLGGLRESLRALGLTVRETPVEQYVVVEAEPAWTEGVVSLDPSRWQVTANVNDENVRNLVDRDAGTSWTTGGPQVPGQSVTVDLGREETVVRVDLLALDHTEVPTGFAIEVSRDGTTWFQTVAVRQYSGPLFWSEHHAMLKARRGRVQARFAPLGARFVRVVQTGSSPAHPWAAQELFLYGPGPAAAPMMPRWGDIASALARAGVEFVYASHWISARVQAESRGTIRAVEGNWYTDDYGHSEPDPRLLDRVRLSKGHAIVLGADADETGIRTMLAGKGARVREVMVGPYRSLVVDGTRAHRRIPSSRWRATASVNAEEAARAIDGDHRTRWGTGTIPGPDPSFTLDLGEVRAVRGVRLTPGWSGNAAREMQLEGSRDGVQWEALGPMRWAGPLYWTGAELLRYGKRDWAVEVPPTQVRHLRLRPTAIAGAASWVIGEIECWE